MASGLVSDWRLWTAAYTIASLFPQVVAAVPDASGVRNAAINNDVYDWKYRIVDLNLESSPLHVNFMSLATLYEESLAGLGESWWRTKR